MLLDDIKTIVDGIPAQLKEKKGLYSFEVTVAERKAFLSTKKLTYRAVFRVDEGKSALRFTEMLKESDTGIGSGDGDLTPGFGFKAEAYKTGAGPREGNITEQSTLFGKKYNYSFDYSKIRKDIEAAAVKAGYGFKYQITTIGL